MATNQPDNQLSLARIIVKYLPFNVLGGIFLILLSWSNYDLYRMGAPTGGFTYMASVIHFPVDVITSIGFVVGLLMVIDRAKGHMYRQVAYSMLIVSYAGFVAWGTWQGDITPLGRSGAIGYVFLGMYQIAITAVQETLRSLILENTMHREQIHRNNATILELKADYQKRYGR